MQRHPTENLTTGLIENAKNASDNSAVVPSSLANRFIGVDFHARAPYVTISILALKPLPLFLRASCSNPLLDRA